jgi:hypothetical protein
VLGVTGWLLLAAVPATYLVLGSHPTLAHLQDTLTTGPGHLLVLAATAAATALATWQLFTGARALHRARRTRPLADAPAALTLAIIARTGAVTLFGLTWWRLAHGATGASRLLTNAHALDAGGRSDLTVNDMITVATVLAVAGVAAAVSDDDAGLSSGDRSGRAGDITAAGGSPEPGDNGDSGRKTPRTFKKPRPGSGKERASDVPSRVKSDPEGRPFVGEPGSQFARRLLDRRYGKGSWSDTGPRSEYNQIKRYGVRGFR